MPIAWYERDKISEILELDANDKYISYVKDSPLDDCNRTACPSPWNPNLPDKPHYKQTDHAYDEGSEPTCCQPENSFPSITVSAADPVGTGNTAYQKTEEEKWVTYE